MAGFYHPFDIDGFGRLDAIQWASRVTRGSVQTRPAEPGWILSKEVSLFMEVALTYIESSGSGLKCPICLHDRIKRLYCLEVEEERRYLPLRCFDCLERLIAHDLITSGIVWGAEKPKKSY